MTKLVIALLFFCMAVPQPRVALVGGSHMQMLGPRVRRDLRARGIRSRVLARQGWGVRRYMLEDDLRPWLRAQRPTVVIFALGNNDYGIRRTRRYRPRLEWALAQVPRGACVIWYGPTAVTPGDDEHLQAVQRNHNRVAEMQREVFADTNVTWIDSRPLTEGNNRRDGIHLTRPGYEAWSTHVIEQIVGTDEGLDD